MSLLAWQTDVICLVISQLKAMWASATPLNPEVAVSAWLVNAACHWMRQHQSLVCAMHLITTL